MAEEETVIEETATEETTAEETTTEETVTTEKEASQFNWREGISDPNALKMAERYTTNEAAMQAQIDMRKQLSKAVVIPGKKSDDVEWTSYRKNMGIPDTADKYEFENIKHDENTPDDQKENLARWQKIFHDENISSKAANNIIKAYLEDMSGITERAVEQDSAFAKETDAKLRDAWKGDYDKNKEYANRAARDILADDFELASQMETKDGRMLLDQPFMVKMLATIGREMGEGRMGEILSDDQVTTIHDKIEDIRAKMDEAEAQGNNKLANKLSAQELELYKRLEGQAK